MSAEASTWETPFIYIVGDGHFSGPHSPKELRRRDICRVVSGHFWVPGSPWKPLTEMPENPLLVQAAPQQPVALPSGAVIETGDLQPVPTEPEFLFTTAFHCERPMLETMGVVCAESVLGVSFKKDLFAQISDFVGGRSKTLEKEFSVARDDCMNRIQEDATGLGANGIIGLRLEHLQVSGQGKNMLAVFASGTAVRLGAHN